MSHSSLGEMVNMTDLESVPIGYWFKSDGEQNSFGENAHHPLAQIFIFEVLLFAAKSNLIVFDHILAGMKKLGTKKLW